MSGGFFLEELELELELESSAPPSSFAPSFLLRSEVIVASAAAMASTTD